MTIDEMRKQKTEHGYTYEQIAVISGVPLGTVQKILGGMTQSPRYDTVKALERFFLMPDSEIDTRSRQMAQSRANGKASGGYTAEDYYSISAEKKMELIDGTLYDFGASTFVRQRIVTELFSQIKSAVDTQGIGGAIPLMAPVDVRPDGDDRTLIRPDIMILCDSGKIKRWGISGAPDFAADVFSPPGRRRDYLKRLAKYAEAGVREYWMIDTEARKLIAYPLERDECLRVYKMEGKVPIGIMEELYIDLKRIDEMIQDYPEE